MMAMQLTHLAYIGFESPAFAEWATLGPEIFGLELVHEGPEAVLLRNDDVVHNIAVHQGPADRVAYLGWATPSLAAWEQAVDDATDAGLAPAIGSENELSARGVMSLARFTDPFGFTHEIVCGHIREPGSFRPGRPMSGFVAGDEGVGHAVVIVPLEKHSDAVRFYIDTMGMRHSDRIPMGPMTVDFLHVGPRHHSFALGGAPGMRGFHHLMLQVNSLNDVGRAYDLCRLRGLQFSMTLGVHTNDEMFSFYVRTPSGFEIEYGWGARRITDESSWRVGRYAAGSIWGHDPNPELAPGACIELTER
jgi:extradiol dioxygenase